MKQEIQKYINQIDWSDSPLFYEVKKYPKVISPKNNNLSQG